MVPNLENYASWEKRVSVPVTVLGAQNVYIGGYRELAGKQGAWSDVGLSAC
jgi:hypothetical protein